VKEVSEARIYNVNCPFCGATFGRPEGKFVLTCEYCGRRSWLKIDGAIPRAVIEPRISKEQAIYTLEGRVFADKQTPQDMATSAKILSAQLYYVPFYEYSGWRGSLVGRRIKDGIGEKHDTSVSLFDFTVYMPAAAPRGWEIDKFEPNSLRAEERTQQRPFARRELASSNAITIAPKRAKEEIRKKLEAIGQMASDIESQVVVAHTKLVYFPFWRIRYRYHGRDYTATIDGTEGRILFARSPRADYYRLPLFVAFLAVAAWLVATLLHSLVLKQEVAKVMVRFALLSEGTLFISIIGLTLFALGFTTLFGLAWDTARYPEQMIYRLDRKEIDKIGRPQMTIFDKLAYHELKLLTRIIQGYAEAEARESDRPLWWRMRRGRWR